MKKIYKSLFFLPLLFLSSCGDPLSFKLASIGVISTMEGVFKNPEINLKEKNYAAADYLASQLIHNKVGYSESIYIMPMEEVDHPGIGSELGLAVPEGIGLRLAELGYNVWLHDVAHGANAGLYPSPKQGAMPKYKMTGRYEVERNDKTVDVFIRVINTQNSKIVAQFDYDMPLNKELKDVSKTPARIYRVK